MCRLLVVSVALVGGCFTELPAMPATESDATTMTGDGGTSTATGTTGAATTGGSPTAGTTDADAPTTGTTTGPPETPEGLFACVEPPDCPVWDCTRGCDAADEAGTCVLSALRDRSPGTLQTIRCDKECALHLLLPRASGADEAQWQWQLLAEPKTLSEVRRCALKPAQFFADCLLNFGHDCADPAAWLVDCAAVEPLCPG